jgi:UDP-N-acetylmuramyl pentapeptide phosphotransferase/UDP-N-acetylglucosamine-1-phosphate transferase
MTDSGGFLHSWILAGLALLVVSAVLTAVLIKLLYPALLRIAVAHPNARSSHKTPTPQGAGIAVIASTTILVAFTVFYVPNLADDSSRIVSILGATILLAVVGAFDDIRALDVLPRLLLQVVAIGIVIAALPADLRIVPVIPWWFERASLLIGGLWFVNLVNFMDGIDWMTVAEVVPVTAGLILAGMMGGLSNVGILVALALLGGIIGLAPYNKPIARIFLGDVGSLPIGLLLFWLLTLLAGSGHLAAAILLPLYYLADASITLFRRLAKREPILQAHRSHFYQRATDRGFTVFGIVTRIFIVNLVLVAFALGTIAFPSHISATIALACGSIVVGWLLLTFTRGKS